MRSSSYSVALYIERFWGKPAAQALLDSYLRSAGPHSATDPPITSSALDFASWSTYRDPIYYHGALFLADLREEIGDETFFELLQRYQETYRFAQATTTDFLSLARDVATGDLDPLIKSWFGITEREHVGGEIP